MLYSPERFASLPALFTRVLLLLLGLSSQSCSEEQYLRVYITNADPNVKTFHITAVLRPNIPPCDEDFPDSKLCRNTFDKDRAAPGELEVFRLPLPKNVNGKLSFDILAFNGECSIQHGQESVAVNTAVQDGSITVTLEASNGCWCSYCKGADCNTQSRPAFNDIRGLSEDDIWAVGDAGTILHWDGAEWTKYDSKTTLDITSLAILGAGDIWAVGSSARMAPGTSPGVVLHWDGTTWTIKKNVDAVLYGIWPTSPGRFLIVGGCGTGNCSFIGSLLEDGALSMERTSTPLAFVRAVWQGSPNGTVYAVGGAGPLGTGDPNRQCPAMPSMIGSVLRKSKPDGNVWVEAPVTHTDQVCNLNAIWGTSDQDIWAIGDYGTVLHWDGSSWSERRNDSVTQGRNLWKVWGTRPSNIWAVGGSKIRSDASDPGAGIVLRWDGEKWTNLQTMPRNLEQTKLTYQIGVWGASERDIWVVGQGGSIQRYRSLKNF